MSSLPLPKNISDTCKKLLKNGNSRAFLFHMKTRVCLKHFVNDCRVQDVSRMSTRVNDYFCMLSILFDYVGFEMPAPFQIHKLKTLPDEVKSLSFRWKNVYKVFPMKFSVFCHNTNLIEIFWKNATYQISLRHTLKKEDC